MEVKTWKMGAVRVEGNTEVQGAMRERAGTMGRAPGAIPDVSSASLLARRPWPLAVGPSFLGFLALAGYWLVVIYQLSAQWLVYPQYGYGWTVPVLCLGLLWRRWHEWSVVSSQWPGVRGPVVPWSCGRPNGLRVAVVGDAPVPRSESDLAADQLAARRPGRGLDSAFCSLCPWPFPCDFSGLPNLLLPGGSSVAVGD